MRCLSRLILAVAVAAICTAQALAQESANLKKIKERKAITLGVRAESSPFSFLDGKQQYVGYSIDLCMKIVEAVKSQLNLPELKVNLIKVNPQTRTPLIVSGDIELECGSSTNSIERQQFVSFVVTTFFTGTKMLVKTGSHIKNYKDLKGKTVVVIRGTTNERAIREYNQWEALGIQFVQAKDHHEALLAVVNGSAVAFPMDDVLLYSMRANAKNPADYAVVGDYLTDEPYGIMLRKDDPAFKKLADAAVMALFRSGEINKIYARWFESPIPPNNANLKLPMSSTLRKYILNPSDKGVDRCGRMQCN